MPLAIQRIVGNGDALGVWHISESEAGLVSLLGSEALGMSDFHSFRSTERKRQWLSVRLTLRALLGTTPEVLYNLDGSPFMKNSDFALSITHSHDYSAVLLSKKIRPGIDIQRISEKVHRIRHKFVHPGEDDLIDCSIDPTKALTILWCAKEAIYKSAGDTQLFFREHICIQPFDLAPAGRLLALVERPDSVQQFRLDYESIDGYMLVYICE